MKTAKRKTNKRKTSKRGGGWFWNDTTTPAAPIKQKSYWGNWFWNDTTKPAASTEQKSSWGSWFSGMFGAKKPVDVPPTPANTPETTSATASVPPTPANTPETTAPTSNAQSTGGKRKTNKRKSKK